MTAVLRMNYAFVRPVHLKFLFRQNTNCNSENEECDFSSTKLDMPSPPKRPLSAYLIFCQEQRKNMTKDIPLLTGVQQIKMLAKKWSDLDPSSKKPYEESARQGIILYSEAHKQFYEKLTETQKELLWKLKTDKKEARKLLKFKKALKESGVPKRPVSAYRIFLKSKAREKKSFTSLSEFVKETSSLWKTMSEADKQPYIEKANLEKEEYGTQMKKWYETMISSGQKHLIEIYNEYKTKGKKSKDSRI